MKDPDALAYSRTPYSSLLTFFRPSAVIYNNLGMNLSNEANIWHEALHGITGDSDMYLLNSLTNNDQLPICRISVQIVLTPSSCTS
jgi:hypothetical protein